MTRSVLFHVQHLLGIGHLRRAGAIARGLVAAGLDVTVASGGLPVPGMDLAGRVVQLPPAVSADQDFSAILDGDGRPIDDAWRQRRRDLLLDTWRAVEPDVLLIELFPFGRRAFRFELLPLLELAAGRRPRPAVLCSVRDILVTKNEAKRTAETLETLRRYFDAVLVHGDRRLVPLTASFAAADAIADIRYTGYVVETETAATDTDDGDGEVVVSAGGGSVGLPLLEAALAARPISAAGTRRWRLVTGPNLPEDDRARLSAAAPVGVIVERFRADFRDVLSRAALSVSQAGYNTVMDVLAAGVPAVLVPFSAGQEMEQTLRARILAGRGRVQLVEAGELSPASLASAIDRALDQARPAPFAVDLDGVATTAKIVADFAAGGRGKP
jgi:predicted glycosyltransferase